jgi:peptidoglycan/xylan/chitin deacetylase (PgdA/CDA1 family)
MLGCGGRRLRLSMLLVVVAALLAAGSTSAKPARASAPATSGALRVATSTQASVDLHVQHRIRTCYDLSPRIWLTFDDGGTPAQVMRILAVLRAERVRAIFFPTGVWAAAHPDLVRRMVRDGHLLGNHTYDHADLMTLTDASAGWDIRHGVRSTATPGPLLRPPYGSGAYTFRLYRLAAEQGQRLCSWTVDTRDWTGASEATIVRRVRTGDMWTPPVGRGGVVLMHMSGKHTGEALPGVISAIHGRGLLLHEPVDGPGSGAPA